MARIGAVDIERTMFYFIAFTLESNTPKCRLPFDLSNMLSTEK
jgi:hypothetical protein